MSRDCSEIIKTLKDHYRFMVVGKCLKYDGNPLVFKNPHVFRDRIYFSAKTHSLCLSSLCTTLCCCFIFFSSLPFAIVFAPFYKFDFAAAVLATCYDSLAVVLLSFIKGVVTLVLTPLTILFALLPVGYIASDKSRKANYEDRIAALMGTITGKKSTDEMRQVTGLLYEKRMATRANLQILIASKKHERIRAACLYLKGCGLANKENLQTVISNKNVANVCSGLQGYTKLAPGLKSRLLDFTMKNPHLAGAIRYMCLTSKPSEHFYLIMQDPKATERNLQNRGSDAYNARVRVFDQCSRLFSIKIQTHEPNHNTLYRKFLAPLVLNHRHTALTRFFQDEPSLTQFDRGISSIIAGYDTGLSLFSEREKGAEQEQGKEAEKPSEPAELEEESRASASACSVM